MTKKNTFSVLFVTRKYPPKTGGMENFSYGLINNYKGKKHSVTYGGSQKYLPAIYPYLFFKAFSKVLMKKVDIIHIGDGVMAPMGFLLKVLTGKKVVMTAHGKDINLKFKPYQIIMPYFFRRMDRIYCVSNSTVLECLKVGIKKDKCKFIPNGVDPNEFLVNKTIQHLRKELGKKYKLNFKGRKILITVGRLSKRKGAVWFTGNVMKKLDNEYLYLIVGPDSTEVNDLKSWFGVKSISYGERLNEIIKKKKLENKVKWLGKIPFDDLKKFYNCADLFIMPNIRVKGDMEGFGIVAIEATSTGLPVIASAIEGIKDAVVENKTGALVKTEDVQGFLKAIENWSEKMKKHNRKKEIREVTKKNYSWDKVVAEYQNQFSKVIN